MRVLIRHTITQVAVLALASTLLFQSSGAEWAAAQTGPSQVISVIIQPPLFPLAAERDRHGSISSQTFPNTAPLMDPLIAKYQAEIESSALRRPNEEPQQAAGSLSMEEEARAAFEAKRERLKPDRLRTSEVRPQYGQPASAPPRRTTTHYYTHAQGVVTAAESGLPVSNVYVAAYDRFGYRRDSEFTDRLGRYQLTLSPGAYFVRFDPGQVYPYYFAPEWYDNATLTNTAALITAMLPVEGLPQNVITVSAVLDRGAQVTGTILASDTGLPVTNTWVVVRDVNGMIVNKLEVEADGQYRTSGLGTGTYQICTFVDVSYGEHTPYLNGCDDNPPAQSTAQVTVTAPNVLPNIQLSLVTGAQVSGVLTAVDTGIGLKTVAVILRNLGSRDYYSTRTITDGLYLINGLPNGQYRLYFSTERADSPANTYFGEYYNGKLTAATADVITLTAPLNTVINVALQHGVIVRGRILAPDNNLAIAKGRVAFVSASVNTVSDLDPVTPVWRITDDQGVYTVTVRPGQYKIKSDSYRISNTLAYCGKYIDGKLTFDEASTVNLTLPETQISDIVLEAAAVISGQISVENTSTPVKNAQISAGNITKPEFGDLELTSTTTDDKGIYRIGGICNTHYKMLIYPPRPYAFRYYPNTLDIDQAAEVPITRGLSSHINAEVSYAGLITGRILSEKTGLPVSDAYAIAVAQVSPYKNASLAYAGMGFKEHYELWVPPGVYRVYFYEGSVFGEPRHCAEWNFDVPITDLAPSILIRPQEYISNINAALTYATIRGTLSAFETGQALSDVHVYAKGLNVYSFVDRDTTDSQGTFELHGICRGQYALRYEPRTSISPTNQYPSSFSGGSATAENATVINIRNSEVVTFNDTLQKGVPLSIDVIVTPTSTIPLFRQIEILDASGHFVYSDYRDFGSAPFNVRLPKGQYKVQAYGQNYQTLYAPYYYNSKAGFAAADLVDLTTTNPISNISIALQSGGAITGRVMDADTHLGLKSVIVLIYDANLPKLPQTYEITNSSGDFSTYSVLAPGTYKLQVMKDGYRTLYVGSSADFEKAALVTVTTGLTTTTEMLLPRLDSQVNLAQRLYMPIVPAIPPPIVDVVPALTPTPLPTATPKPPATPTASPGQTVVFSGTAPSGQVGRSVVVSNFIQISDIKVKGDLYLNEGDEYIDLLNRNQSQTVSMPFWRLRVNGVLTHFIPGGAAASQNFAIPAGQGCRIYTGYVITQQVPAPYNWCGNNLSL